MHVCARNVATHLEKYAPPCVVDHHDRIDTPVPSVMEHEQSNPHFRTGSPSNIPVNISASRDACTVTRSVRALDLVQRTVYNPNCAVKRVFFRQKVCQVTALLRVWPVKHHAFVSALARASSTRTRRRARFAQHTSVRCPRVDDC